MRRNWEAVRLILLALEENGPDLAIKSVYGVSNEDFVYHVTILSEGDLIRGGSHIQNDGTKFASALRLTWAGHELLDKMRDDTTWDKIKNKAGAQGVALSIDVIGWVFKEVMKKKLGIDLS